MKIAGIIIVESEAVAPDRVLFVEELEPVVRVDRDRVSVTRRFKIKATLLLEDR